MIGKAPASLIFDFSVGKRIMLLSCPLRPFEALAFARPPARMVQERYQVADVVPATFSSSAANSAGAMKPWRTFSPWSSSITAGMAEMSPGLDHQLEAVAQIGESWLTDAREAPA